jgi:zinc and cadmium transporter
MFWTWAYTFISVGIVSTISLVGIFFLSMQEERLRRVLHWLVSFAIGGLFGDAFIHLLPEAFEKAGHGLSVPILTLSGILLFFILEKFMLWRHCHVPTSQAHPHPVVAMNLIGDGIHNLLDGMIIGAGFQVSPTLGISTTLAIILHEIPQEIGDYGVLVHGGLSPQKALRFNFLSALISLVGAFLSLAAGLHSGSFSFFVLPMTAGGFIYIAGTDLIPELRHETALGQSAIQLFFIALGVALMALLLAVG